LDIKYLNSSTYLEEDSDKDLNNIKSSIKIAKSRDKGKRKIISYHYEDEKKIDYDFKKNVSDSFDEDSVSEYNEKDNTDEKSEYKIFIMKNFSEISLNSNIIRALRRLY
jgi:hypothetical protein